MMKRREFLKSLTVASTATLVAGCESVVTPNDALLERDLTFLNEAAEMEAVAIASYNAAASSGLITSEGVLSVAVLFRDHHISHLEELNALRRRFGLSDVQLSAALPDPRVGGVSSQTDVLALARQLELEAAEGYFSWVIQELRIPEVRRFFANTYPIEAAHFIVLKGVLNDDIPAAIDAAQLEFLRRQ